MVGLGLGGAVGAAVGSIAALPLLTMTPLAGLWAGVRPWRRKRFARALIARRLVYRKPGGFGPADPIVDRVVEREELARFADDGHR